MIKKLKQDGNRIYFTDGEIIFKVYNWYGDVTIEKVKQGLKEARFPDYIPTGLEEYKQNSLVIFDLTIQSTWSELKPLNISLWEYEIFIKGSSKPDPALKSAFISKSDDYNYIACESYDNESMLTDKNLLIIERYMAKHKQELEKILNTDLIGFEVYR